MNDQSHRTDGAPIAVFVAPKQHQPRRNVPLAEGLRECRRAVEDAEVKRSESLAARRNLLQQAYGFAVEVQRHSAEFEQLCEQHALPTNARTDVFAKVLKLIYTDDGRFRRRVNREASALRYLDARNVAVSEAAEALRKEGGIDKCARKWAELNRTAVDECHKQSATLDDAWQSLMLPKHKRSTLRLTQAPMKRGRYVVFVYCSDGVMRINRVVPVRAQAGDRLVRTAARLLKDQ